MRAQLAGKTKQLVDVAFPVCDVHASAGLAEQFRRLPQVLQPANAFFVLNRNAGGIYLAFQRVGAVKLVSGPELDRCKSQRQSDGISHQAGVHQNPATGVEPRWSGFAGRQGQLLQNPDGGSLLMPIRKLGRVVKNQHRKTYSGGESFTRRAKVPGQDVGFADARVAEKPVRRFRVRPVLAGPRRCGAHPAGQLLQ